MHVLPGRNCARDRKGLEPAGGAGALEGTRPRPRKPRGTVTYRRLVHFCPECGAKLEHEGGCVTRRQCGYSHCSDQGFDRQTFYKDRKTGPFRKQTPERARLGIEHKKSSEGRGLLSGGWNQSWMCPPEERAAILPLGSFNKGGGIPANGRPFPTTPVHWVITDGKGFPSGILGQGGAAGGAERTVPSKKLRVKGLT